jgi:NAD dependent epimerase/dehydratase family enzyme
MEYAFVHDQMNGVYNLSSPQPVTNRYFMATLQSLTKTPVAFPAFTWMLQIGASLIGTETELLLKSRWVVPTRLLEAGFTFTFPELDGAMENILSSLPKRQYKLFVGRTPANTMAT